MLSTPKPESGSNPTTESNRTPPPSPPEAGARKSESPREQLARLVGGLLARQWLRENGLAAAQRPSSPWSSRAQHKSLDLRP